jgi:hypothetical protein
MLGLQRGWDRAPRPSVQRLVRQYRHSGCRRAACFRDATMAPVSPAPRDNPVPIVKRTNGPPPAPTANKTIHPPKQTALIARSVTLRGERYSRQSEGCFSVVFIIAVRSPPNDRTERRGRPSASALATAVARPRSLQ